MSLTNDAIRDLSQVSFFQNCNENLQFEEGNFMATSVYKGFEFFYGKSEDALKYGINAAILLNYIRLMCNNAEAHANKDYFLKNEYWCKIGIGGLHKLYPFISISTIRRTLQKLFELKAIDKIETKIEKEHEANFYRICENVDSLESNQKEIEEKVIQTKDATTKENDNECNPENKEGGYCQNDSRGYCHRDSRGYCQTGSSLYIYNNNNVDNKVNKQQQHPIQIFEERFKDPEKINLANQFRAYLRDTYQLTFKREVLEDLIAYFQTTSSLDAFIEEFLTDDSFASKSKAHLRSILAIKLCQMVGAK